MAGDWIKMRTDLFTHPKVVRISSALSADRLRTVGGLMSVWCLFDAHSIDGQLEGYTFDTIDDLIGWKGFAAAMNTVGWLDQNPEGLSLPRFEAHNGTSAKRRAQETDRKRESRASASDADKKRTREEKRREEVKDKAPSVRKAKISLPADFGISERVQVWAMENNHAHLEAHLSHFVGYARANGKTYADWDQAFMNAIRDNWAKVQAPANGTAQDRFAGAK